MNNICLSITGALCVMVLAGPARAQIIYQDTFNYIAGNLSGNAPDTMDSGGDKWVVPASSGSPVFPVNSGVVTTSNGSGASVAYLKVNDNASDQLTGLQDFTLSATVQSTNTSTGVYLSLNNGSLPTVGGKTGNPLAYLAGFAGQARYDGPTGTTNGYNFSINAATPVVLSLVYSASGGTINELLGSTVVHTYTGVTVANISSLTNVSVGYGNIGAGGSFQSFELQVTAVPEASSAWSVTLGLCAVVGGRMIHRRRLVLGRVSTK